MCCATAPCGTGGRPATPALACEELVHGRADIERGIWGIPGGAGPGAAARPGGRRQHRAGLRHRLCLGLGWPAAAPGRSPWTTRPGQLTTARELQERFGLRFPLFHANAERTPFADASFDLAISEYGASIWCDPYAWIPEAARLLRPGGQLIFLVNSVLMMLTIPDEDGLPATVPAAAPVLRHAPVRVARRRLGGVPSRPRRHDPAAAPLLPGGRGPPRTPARARCRTCRTRWPPSSGHGNGRARRSGRRARPVGHSGRMEISAPGH